MKTLRNWIIIAGNGRNTGKTTLACQIISANKGYGVTGIKISPHHHSLRGTEEIIFQGTDFCIIREKALSGKDSSRMLQAGASEVFYVQCPDDSLQEMFFHLEKLTVGRPVVCESGGLRKLVCPGAFIMVLSGQNTGKAGIDGKILQADILTDLDSIGNQNPDLEFHFRNNEWKHALTYDTI